MNDDLSILEAAFDVQTDTFVVGRELEGVNAGAFVVRNSPEGRAFLEEWSEIAKAERKLPVDGVRLSDQGALHVALNNRVRRAYPNRIFGRCAPEVDRSSSRRRVVRLFCARGSHIHTHSRVPTARTAPVR